MGGMIPIPTQYPDNIHHYFYFQELLPVFHQRIWQEKDPDDRYENLRYLLHDCWAIDLLELDNLHIRDCLDDWGLSWARLVATAFRSGKLHGRDPYDLLEDFKRLVIDHAIKAESVWECNWGFKYPDGTEITEIGDFFEEALTEASDSEKSDDHESHHPSIC